MSLPPGIRVVALATLLLVGKPAGADAPLRNTVQIGITHFSPGNNRSAIRTAVVQNPGTLAAGLPPTFDSPAAAIDAQAVNTMALTFGRRLSTHWQLELDVGVPPVVRARGSGVIDVPTRLGRQLATDLGDPALNPLGSTRLWAPALLLQYHPRGTCRELCPYLGVGLSYAWFTDEQLGAAFAERLNTTYGRNLALLAGKPGDTRATVRVKSALAPAFALGMTTAIGARWGLTAAAGYVPLATDAVLQMRASDGSLLASTRNRMRTDGVITALLLSYGW